MKKYRVTHARASVVVIVLLLFEVCRCAKRVADHHTAGDKVQLLK